MATSDNVVRAGLTSKFKDIEELVEMLNYHASEGKRHLLVPQKISKAIWEYKPEGIEEFKVLFVKLGYEQQEQLR